MACSVELELAKNGAMVREKRGTLGCIMRLKRRISHSFGRMLSREDIIPVSDQENENVAVTMVIRNGYSYDFLDVLSIDKEPNGNIPSTEMVIADNAPPNDDTRNNEPITADMGNQQSDEQHPQDLPQKVASKANKPDLVRRQHSDSDGPARESQIVSDPSVVQLRQIKPPRPKSECMLLEGTARSHRFSAFRGASPFGKTDTYVKLEKLGEGSYATVFKGISNLNNKLVALKEIRLQEEEGTPFTAIREASLLKELRHSNVVTLHDIIHTKETLTFVFEFVNTDLSQYLEKHGGGLHPTNVKLFFFQLIRGLAFIHEKKILHRDLKPQNLLISEIGELKLADFGLARAKSVPSRTYSHEVVTLWYRPPDVLMGSTDYSTSLDMWGVGCIFIEMITGAPAFPGIKDSSDQLNKIWKVLGTPTEETWEGVTRFQSYKLVKFGNYKPQTLANAFPKLSTIQNAERIASELLQVQPRLRLKSGESLRHPYFADLPPKIYDLPDQVSIFNVPGCKLMPEQHNHPLSVIRAAAKLRDKR